MSRSPLLLLTLLGLAAPAHSAPGGPGLPMRVVVAPPKPLPGVRTLTVGSFTGFNGSLVADGILKALQDPERALPDTGLDGVGVALVGVAVGAAGDAAGAAVGSVTGGLGAKATDSLVTGTGEVLMAQIGKDRIRLDDGLRVDVIQPASAGGDATISGKIEVKSKDEAYKAKQAKVDSKGNTVKDSEGKTVYVEVDCTKRTTTVTLAWVMVGAGDAPLLNDTEVRSASDSRCGADRGSLSAQDTLAANALGNPGVSIVNTFAPAWNDFRIDLDKSKAINDDLKLAQQGQTFLAACNVRRALQDDAFNPDILYSLGGLLESMGDLDAAAQHYTKAISAGNKGAGRSLERTKKRKADLEILATTYGQAYKVAPVSWDGCPATPDGRRTETKREVVLLSMPSGGSELATLPKGMEVYAQQTEGEMTFIKLQSGEEGWISAKSVK